MKAFVAISCGLLAIIFVYKICVFIKLVEVNTVSAQASINIEESKRSGFFLEQYIALNAPSEFFQVHEGWVEYVWKYTLKGEKMIKNKLENMQFVFAINKYNNIKEDEYLLTWDFEDSAYGSVTKANAYSVDMNGKQLPDSFIITHNYLNGNRERKENARIIFKRKRFSQHKCSLWIMK